VKLYTYPQAPSPRRIHLFLAEKGLDIEQEVIDIRAGAHFNPDFAGRNRQRTVPVLELDDGTCLSESVAICRYLEDLQPSPPLFGNSAAERAFVVDRDHWVEMNGLLAVMDAFRNSLPGMADRALPGPRRVAKIAELAERGRQRYGWFMADLDEQLADREFIAGNDFSVADITALVTIDFASRGIKMDIPDELTHLTRWYAQVNARPAVQVHSEW
jgi:glutathione S-transferase